ncbi:MAG: hypothetical protein AAF585_19475 [Verrucomicrobiota bacterium]
MNRVISVIFLAAFAAAGFAGEDPKQPPYSWPEAPKYSLDLNHAPFKGWRIERVESGKHKVFLRKSGKLREERGVPSKDNPMLKGIHEDLFLLHFDYGDYRKAGGSAIPSLAKDEIRPVFLGWDFHDFSKRYNRWTGEGGFSRKFIIPNEFEGIDAEPLSIPNYHVDTRSKDADWQRFMMPIVTAEGMGDFMIANSFDRAGMTVGLFQLAAHTPEDMIPMMKHLISSETLKRDKYANPQRWFPELGITADGKLGYRKPGTSGPFASLEESTKRRNSNEGFRWKPAWASWYREDFVRFCNPDCTEINQAELHFAARWIMWSMSPKMRAEQLKPSMANVVRSLQKLDIKSESVNAADVSPGRRARRKQRPSRGTCKEKQRLSRETYKIHITVERPLPVV